MRGVITCSGIIVVIALIVMIHASITGNNIRRDEVNRSLDGAMDFAFDRMGDVYADKYFILLHQALSQGSYRGILCGFK